jgi:hypothetical protein
MKVVATSYMNWALVYFFEKMSEGRAQCCNYPTKFANNETQHFEVQLFYILYCTLSSKKLRAATQRAWMPVCIVGCITGANLAV